MLFRQIDASLTLHIHRNIRYFTFCINRTCQNQLPFFPFIFILIQWAKLTKENTKRNIFFLVTELWEKAGSLSIHPTTTRSSYHKEINNVNTSPQFLCSLDIAGTTRQLILHLSLFHCFLFQHLWSSKLCFWNSGPDYVFACYHYYYF